MAPLGGDDRGDRGRLRHPRGVRDHALLRGRAVRPPGRGLVRAAARDGGQPARVAAVARVRAGGGGCGDLPPPTLDHRSVRGVARKLDRRRADGAVLRAGLRDLHGRGRRTVHARRGRLRCRHPPDRPALPTLQPRRAHLLRRQRDVRRHRRRHRRTRAVVARHPGADRVGDPGVRDELRPQHRVHPRARAARRARARRGRVAADARGDRDLLRRQRHTAGAHPAQVRQRSRRSEPDAELLLGHLLDVHHRPARSDPLDPAHACSCVRSSWSPMRSAPWLRWLSGDDTARLSGGSVGPPLS